MVVLFEDDDFEIQQFTKTFRVVFRVVEMWSKWASASYCSTTWSIKLLSQSITYTYIGCVLGSLDCWTKKMSVCYPWAMALILQSTKPFLTPWRELYLTEHSSGLEIWESFISKVEWFTSSLNRMFCCCFVVDNFLWNCLSFRMLFFVLRSWKCFFYEFLGIQYSSYG